MQPAPDEQELIKKAQNGDEQAVALLYEAHVESIYGYIGYRVNSDEVAEDLTSEVFLRMVRGLQSYQYQGFPFRAWLYRIASNLVMDYYRQQGKHPTSSVTDDFMSNDPELFDQIAQEDERFRLRLAIRALPEEYQNLLIWRFVEDLPHTEIARITNKSAEALRAMQYRALKALAQQLDKLNRNASGEENP
ncbi:MAG TPA: sigma-70 family RNA polymerase sigma factor [Oceanobacillus sp.]|jgi:RNA polymerase sigma-70 factor (ECF subfamily)|nr:sigma-70 family RNA polymerase sigma factor [Oceanobacillus sp.]